MVRLSDFNRAGWVRFPADDRLSAWVAAARAPALAAAADPGWQRQWLRSGGTWFVGVHALPNAADGSVAGVPLAGAAVDFARSLAPVAFDWDRAQVSVCYPGYPQPGAEEGEPAYRYRLKRDAAHLDGLHRSGPDAQRLLKEYHGFLLGIALSDAPPQAAPFVVWEGSHVVLQAMLARAFAGIAPADWPQVDVAAVYHDARRAVFDSCPRVELPIRPGEAFFMHRHMLHGMAPWSDGLDGPPEGRAIAYFRPELPVSRPRWLAPD